MQTLGNKLNDFYNKISDVFSEHGLDDFVTKFNEILRIIKRFDGDDETNYFPKFNKIYDTLLAFKKDAIDKLNSINGSLEKLSEDVTNGFLMVAEIFKKLNDFVTNFNTKLKPKIININNKIN